MNVLAPLKRGRSDLASPLEETSLLRFCGEELEAEIETLPQAFIAYLEDKDEYVCSRAELIEAIRMAPNKLARQILYSEYRFREYLTMVAGRQMGFLDA